MSTFPELRGLRSEVDGDTLKLPIGDTTYEFPKSIPMRAGLALAEARVHAKEIAASVAAGTFDPDRDPGFHSITEDQLRAEGQPPLPRVPGHRAFWFSWHAAYPDTQLIR